MDITSAQLRKRLGLFDKAGIFSRKVSKAALLRDTGYWVPAVDDLRSRVASARLWMAKILKVGADDLPAIMSNLGSDNGRMDCDNFAYMGCYILKAEFDAQCRRDNPEALEYAILPVALNDKDHMQALCLAQDGFYDVEFITGSVLKTTILDIYLIG